MKGFENKKVLITGASKGIGKSIAQELLVKGASVTISGKNNRNGWWDEFSNCDFICLDFSKENDWKILSNLISKTSFDMFVHCSGQFYNNPLLKSNENAFHEQYKINMEAPAQILKIVLPSMLENAFGRIVFITSIAANLHRPGTSFYASTKAGLLTFTRTMALELAPRKILINSVSPGYTLTEMLESLNAEQKHNLKENIPLGRFCNPKEVAKAVLFLLSPENTYITGQNLIIDGGVTLKQ